MLNVLDNRLLSYRHFYADSLGECIEQVHLLKNLYTYDKSLVNDPVMWFRGQSFAEYDLSPSLYRELYGAGCSNTKCENKTTCEMKDMNYGLVHMAEELRYQNYRARNFGLSSRGSEYSKVEWLAHMQHHGMKTRLLDWSESLIHAILFAVEPLLDPKSCETKIGKMTPHVWVLFPQMLNAKVLNRLHGVSASENMFAEQWFGRFRPQPTDDEKKEIKRSLYNCIENGGCAYGGCGEIVEDRLNLMFNLSAIRRKNDELERKGLILEAMKTGNYISPLFPLIAEFYLEGANVEPFELPPFAFVQERHSDRIYSQKGVFTIFPFYRCDRKQKMKVKMENIPECRGTIFKIELRDCERIAKELLEIGVRRDWLYPEDPVVSETMEYKL